MGIESLKVEITGNGGGRLYTGYKRDTQLPLDATFVRKHFKSWFLELCAADSSGKPIRVPIGASEIRPTPSGASLGATCEPASSGGLDSCLKPVKYRDAEKGLCAPMGLASALHNLGAFDNQGADLGARIAKVAPKLAKAHGKGKGGNDIDAVKGVRQRYERCGLACRRGVHGAR